MRLSRARYITICQQFLVTALVLAVGLSAAGIMTLQIVTPESRSPQASALAPAIKVSDAYVDSAPVTPKVREVKVAGVDAAAAREIPGVVTSPGTSKDKAAAPDKLVALSAPTTVHGYATVGVTWNPGAHLEDGQISVQVRTAKAGTWSDWAEVKFEAEEGPADDGSEGGSVRPGTDPLIIGNVDQVQMKAETVDGTAPAGLRLAVIDPGAGKLSKEPAAIDTAKLASGSGDGTGKATSSAPSADGDAAALTAMTVSPKPTIYSRAQWGANEALRDKSSLRYGTIQTGFIHHTVNANDYTPEQVPALIRGIYAYHTQSRGWSDIGYNFLVDRFGRIWEGRYGGVDRPVVGAHTRGYNEYSFAMSAIGNYELVKPSKAVKQAFMQLFAWKLSLNNIRADASHLWVKDRYLYAINGHRDVGTTACPGRYLYAKIPKIRVGAQAIQDAAQTPVDPANLAPLAAPAGVPSPTQAPAAAVPQPAIQFPVRASSLFGSAWPDLVAKSPTGAIVITSTEGMLGFGPRVVVGGAWAKKSKVVAVGDMTGDGKGDVLARTRSGSSKIFPGDGAGHVGPGIARTKAFDGYDLVIGAGDFDRDGHDDVIARVAKSTALVLFRGAGKGKFRDPVVLKKKWPYRLTTAVGRFDAGKKPDLLAMTDSGALFLVPGRGDKRALGDRVQVGVLPADASGLYGVGDVTGDGNRDIAVRSSAGTMIYAGNGAGALGQAYGPFPDLGGVGGTSTGDLLANRGLEIAGRDASGQLVVVGSNGLRNVGTSVTSNLVVPGAKQVLDVGDWDRNGTADLITREAGGDQLVLRPGLGNGMFGRGQSLGTGWTPVSRLAAVGDVTGDGYPDLIGRTASSPLTIFPGAGTSGFKAPVLAPSTLRAYNQIGAAAWTPDGATFSSEDGTFVPLSGMQAPDALGTANGTSAATYDSYVGVGDVNGDGVADILAREKGTGVIWLLPGKTSGGFAPRMWVAAGFAGYQLLG